jgi:hypothetical protein
MDTILTHRGQACELTGKQNGVWMCWEGVVSTFAVAERRRRVSGDSTCEDLQIPHRKGMVHGYQWRQRRPAIAVPQCHSGVPHPRSRPLAYDTHFYTGIGLDLLGELG